MSNDNEFELPTKRELDEAIRHAVREHSGLGRLPSRPLDRMSAMRGSAHWVHKQLRQRGLDDGLAVVAGYDERGGFSIVVTWTGEHATYFGNLVAADCLDQVHNLVDFLIETTDAAEATYKRALEEHADGPD